jgi:hypothetical protein
MSDSSPDRDAEAREILLAFYAENVEQARHHEQQRQTVTSVVALAAAVVVGLVASRGPLPASGTTLFLAGALLGTLGAYGFVASLRHHERARLHVERAHAVREGLWQRFPGGVGELYAEANRRHARRYPRLSERTARLHYAWQAVHVAVALVGSALAAAALLG